MKVGDWVEEITRPLTCLDIWDIQGLIAYEKDISRLIQSKYYKTTRRWVSLPDVMVDIEIPETAYLCYPQ